MKTVKKLLFAFALLATAQTYVGCTQDAKPAYEIPTCKPVEDPIKNVGWLQEAIKSNYRTNFPEMKIYTAELDSKFVYLIDDGNPYVYTCDGKSLCYIMNVAASDDNDPRKCNNMIARLQNKKLIYQH